MSRVLKLGVVAGVLVVLPAQNRAAELAEPEGRWTLVSPISQPRSQSGVVRLESGKVLVFGSHSVGQGPVASAELYDPETDRWTKTGQLNTPRNGIFQSVAVLPDGRVLLCGEHSGDRVVSGSELYDQNTGKWAKSGTMKVGRGGHTAVRLDSGRVLAAGGMNWETEKATATAEVYDPGTGQWTETGPMHQRRFSHRAVRLPDGRILVTGGRVVWGGEILASAEIYDPGRATWSRTADMEVRRRNHESVLLASGKVLVIGGTESRVGELYDPATESWTATAPMQQARISFTATLASDGSVLVVGGAHADGSWKDRASAERYDPSTNTWHSAGTMSTPRRHHRAVGLADGGVLVIGGFTFPRYLRSVELYHPGRTAD